MASALAALPRLRELLETRTRDDVEVCELVAAALAEVAAKAPYDFEDMRRRATDTELVAYVRALRLSFICGDPVVTRVMRHRGNVTSVATMLWLIEAYLSLGEARAWYAAPLNGVTNGMFPVLGLVGQFDLVRESAQGLAARRPGTRPAASTLAAESNWKFDECVVEYTSFQLDSLLEFLSWIVTAQLRPAKRSREWVSALEALFGLARARAVVMCTMRLPPGDVDEQHRFAENAEGWGVAGGGAMVTPSASGAKAAAAKALAAKAAKAARAARAARTARTRTAKRARTARRATAPSTLYETDSDGGLDDDGGSTSSEDDDEATAKAFGGDFFAEKAAAGAGATAGATTTTKPLADDTQEVHSAFRLCVEAYISSIEAELALAKTLVITQRPALPKPRPLREKMFAEIADLDKVETLEGFNKFVARAALLPCDRRVYEVRIQQRDPSPGEVATKKNHNMVAVEERDIEDAAKAYERLFGDFMLDLVLRTYVAAGDARRGSLPTDAVEPGDGRGWVPPAPAAGGPAPGPVAWETTAPTLAQLALGVPRTAPALFRCAVLDVYCVSRGGGEACNSVVAFTSIVAAVVWMRERDMLGEDVCAALDFEARRDARDAT